MSSSSAECHIITKTQTFLDIDITISSICIQRRQMLKGAEVESRISVTPKFSYHLKKKTEILLNHL